jgi:hypothetical protein
MARIDNLKKAPKKGRKPGSKGAIPPTFKASLKRIFNEIATEEPGLLKTAIRDGIMAKPPYSFQYIQVAAHYIDGKPSDKVEHEGAVEFRWKTEES